MTTFSYVGTELSGKRKTGHIEAPSRDAAVAQLASHGTYVLEIKEQASRTASEHSSAKGRVTKTEIAMFTRRLADLSGAGLPLDRTLQVAADQAESATLRRILFQAYEDVRTGLPVSDALGKYPKLFPTIFTQTLRAGEASGQFPQVTERLADFQEMEVKRRGQIVSALVYPSILAFAAVAVVIFMLTFVVPRLSGVFADLGSDLPATTKILLASTHFLTHNWIVILGIAAGGFVLYRLWTATENGASTRDRALLSAPMVGKIVSKAIVSRYARILGTLVYGGVPFLEALRIAGLATGNRVYQKSSVRLEEEVRDGSPLALAMQDVEAFPPVLVHMVAIGEETGDLPKMLGRVSDSLDFEVNQGLQRLTSMVEPVIVIFVGAFVGFVVLSVLLPIYQAQNLVK